MAQDRYGPTRASSQSASSYDAPAATLAWSGKTYGQQAESPAQRSAPPQPLANGALRNTSVSPYARLQIAPSVQTTQPAQGQRLAPQPAPVQTASAQPAPARAPLAAPVAGPALRPAQPPVATVASAPINRAPAEAQPAQVQAAAQPAPPVTLAGGPPAQQTMAMTAPLSGAVFDGVAAPEEVTTSSSAAVRARMAANAANSGGTVSPRYYSVHSAYGMAADPIPLTQTGVGQ